MKYLKYDEFEKQKIDKLNLIAKLESGFNGRMPRSRLRSDEKESLLLKCDKYRKDYLFETGQIVQISKHYFIMK